MHHNVFADRIEAGRLLAESLSSYRKADAVVLALPRGGVVLGREMADILELPLDIVVTRKIGHPFDPEYAICATDADGVLLCDEIEKAKVDQAWLRESAQAEQAEAKRRLSAYRGDRQPVSLGHKTVIIVDDGIATGLSMRLAVKAVKAQGPSRLVVAVPVASADMVELLKREVDEVVVLVPPENFVGAVGAHYRHFPQVSDGEVIGMLNSSGF